MRRLLTALLFCVTLLTVTMGSDIECDFDGKSDVDVERAIG
jgi:hypothetical protein